MVSSKSAIWTAFGASVRGAQHRREGRPNQDAVAWSPQAPLPQAGEAVAAVAVADGHGHASGLRAGKGARIAVETAVRLAAAGMPGITGPDGASGFLASLPDGIKAAWDEQVRREASVDPFGEGELAGLPGGGGTGSRSALLLEPGLAYGTTVILAAAVGEHLLLAQLGDGDVLLVEAGGAVARALTRDPYLVANQTWSLSSGDAARRFTTLLVPAASVELVLVATDGYSNSFRDAAGFDQTGSDMLEFLRRFGWPELTRKLPEWLASTTEEGSGDDVTVGLLAKDVTACAVTRSGR